MSLNLTTDLTPDPARREDVRKGLRAYNLAQTDWQGSFGDFAIYVRDDEGGEIVGGLWANYGFDWMFVELLSVPEAARGQGLGRQMMAQAETRAKELGLVGIWLDTFSFQAQGFYEKLGYQVFGRIDDFPRGEQRFYLSKRLD